MMMVIMITWSVSFSSSSSSSSDDDDGDDVNFVQEEEEEEEVDPSLPVQLRSVADHIEDLQEVILLTIILVIILTELVATLKKPHMQVNARVAKSQYTAGQVLVDDHHWSCNDDCHYDHDNHQMIITNQLMMMFECRLSRAPGEP